VNDLEFFFELLDNVNQNNILDLNRVYAIGYSNGGMFSHFLACNTENIFAAIGDVAGTMLLDTYNNCNPSSPVPVLKIHGTYDNVVSYNGFDQAGFKKVEDVINFWKINNKSNDQFILNNFVSSSWANYMGPVNFEKYIYESNENDSEVIHYKMLGGGHWWDYSLDNDLKTSSLLWNFFSEHTKQ
jgi:polyhydroxybutyrate depolymerase